MPALPPPSPELDLLLDCARARLDPTARERVCARLLRPLDWDRALALAERHRVTPLLYLQVDDCGRADAPPRVLETLRERASRNASHQHLLVAELREILETLTRRGVRVVPFEGPAPGAALHGNIALRDARDVELLVRPEDAAAAADALAARGYRAAGRRAPGEIVLQGPGPARVAIHAELLHRCFGVAPQRGCWDRLARGSLLGREVASLRPEELLVTRCGHAARHGWERLQWLSDVGALLQRHRDLDWDETWRVAEGRGGARMLALGLHLAAEALGAPVPEAARRRARADRVVPALAASALTAMELAVAPPAAWKEAFHRRARDPRGLRLRRRLGARWLEGVLTPLAGLAGWLRLGLPARRVRPALEPAAPSPPAGR